MQKHPSPEQKGNFFEWSCCLYTHEKLVAIYTARTLSFDSEGMNAFQGIGIFGGEYKGPFFFTHCLKAFGTLPCYGYLLKTVASSDELKATSLAGLGSDGVVLWTVPNISQSRFQESHLRANPSQAAAETLWTRNSLSRSI